MLKRLFGSRNRRVRILVGALLASLLLIHVTQSHANRTVKEFATVVQGRVLGANSGGVRQTVDQLARTDHVALLRLCLDSYQGRFQDYTCTFVKQERIGGRVGDQQTIAVQFTDKPFRVGMAWTENPPIGDRVLYVEGRYDNHMLVRPAAKLARMFVPTAKRLPDSPEVLKSTLRPVNLFGFRRSIESLIEVYEQARTRGELREEFGGYAEVGGRPVIVLNRYLPNAHDYPAHLTKIYIDTEYLLPIMVEGYGWNDDEFLCRYVYRDMKFNVGLTGGDFEPADFDMVEPG